MGAVLQNGDTAETILQKDSETIRERPGRQTSIIDFSCKILWAYDIM